MSKKAKGIVAIVCVLAVLLGAGYKGYTMYRNVHAKLNDILFVVDKNTKAINDIALTLTDQGSAVDELSKIANENAELLNTLIK